MRKTMALTAAELRLALRNRTLVFSTLLVPLALGVFWAWSFGRDPEPGAARLIVALQLAVVLGMGVYVTSTITVVARRHARVLGRLRTSGLSDGGLLAATVAPAVVIAAVQLAVFAGVDAVTGVPWPADPVPLVLALVGGLALCVAAGLVTTIVTSNPERAQITTMPLTFVLLGSAVALATLPPEGVGRALVALPGAAVGDLARLAFDGGTWDAGAAGLPAALPALVALVVWPVVFAVVARRRFRWDDRSAA